LRILLGCEVFYPYVQGGGEVFSYNLALQLVRLGHEVHVICPSKSFDHPDADLPSYSKLKRVHIHRVQGEFKYNQGTGSLPIIQRMSQNASALIAQREFDVVNPQTFRPCLALFPAAKRGIAVVATIFDVYSRGRACGLENWLKIYGKFGVFGWATEQAILRLPYDRIITNSEASKKKILAYKDVEPIDVVRCGVNLDDYPREIPKKIPGRILYLGRLSTYKNIPDLFSAAEKLKRTGKEISLVIAGTGPLEAYVKQVCSQFDYVRFKHRPTDREKVKLLREAEVLVLPSSEEGFGIVLLEANAAHTPFVSYDVPALRETARLTRGGLLAAHRNVNDLARKIRILLDDSELSGRLAKAGRRSVEHKFSWERAARMVEKVYTQASLKGDRRVR